jgi:S1-C subfamily serine protease
VAATAVFGVQSAGGTTTVVGQGSASAVQPATTQFDARGGFGSGTYGYGYGSGAGAGGSTAATGTATAAQEVGVVDIDTVLQYQDAQAAGTGMVLSSDGEILTNNHVVAGATSISVTVVSTGTTYTAVVVGTDPTDDVAVLRLQRASGLQTVSLSTAAAQVGQSVTAVGNAGGTGGTPTAAAGQVTAVSRTITASDETGSSSEQLTGLIETDANVQSGDSGGPLYDSAGAVIGMDTAASSGGTPDGYAIPIATAVSIARQIEAGVDTGTIHSGYPAFLGVSVQDGDGGALVAGVAAGSAADDAGIAAGDTVTAVGGHPVTSADGLGTALESYSPGSRVPIAWTDASGTGRSATVVLGTGPAD